MSTFSLVGDEAVFSDAYVAEPVFGAVSYREHFVLRNIHDPARCAGRTCILHHPTDHHMSDWPLLWRDDRGIFERLCPCGIGHPDPDQHDYWVQRYGEKGAWAMGVHGCCGHCAAPS